VFDFLLRTTRSRLLQDTAIHIDAHLGRHLYNRFRVLPLHVLESKPTNYWRSLFQDTQVIRSVFSGPSAVLVADIPFALLYLIVIFIIATPIAWALFIIIPAFLLLTWWSTQRMTEASASETKRNLNHDMLISEMLAGRVTVKSLRIDAVTQPHYEDLHADSIEDSYERGMRTDTSIAMGQTLSLSSTALLVTLGALAIIDGEMTIGALIATTMLTARIIAPLNQLLSGWRGFARCKQAIEHLDKLEALPREKDESSVERPRPKGLVQVENISVRYEGADQPIIKDCSFVLQPGQMVGLVGVMVVANRP
jgi:ABC-type bacteriocin/lantibiotic exporters, contain an N-terminal double-glycine peptidase domain